MQKTNNGNYQDSNITNLQEAQERAKQKREEERRKQEQEWRNTLKLTIPPKFKNSDIENFIINGDKEEQKKIVGIKNKVINFVKKRENFFEGNIIIFSGNVGTGKTHLATALTKEAFKRYKLNCLFTTAGELMRNLEETRSYKCDKSEQDLIDYYKGFELLVIDELTTELGTNLLYEIINARYNHLKTTIITTNIKPIEIEGLFDNRLMDRVIDNNGFLLEFNYSSRRGGLINI